MRSALRSPWKSAVLGGLFCTACAFGDRHVRLQYPSAPETAAVAASAPITERVVHLGALVDRRAEKSRIGEVLNGWGMHTADVVADGDVVAWVRDGLRLELERAGFTVLPAPPEPGRTELAGEVLEVHCSAYFEYEARVQLRFELRRDGAVLQQDVLAGKGSAGMNWAATEAGYGESLGLALRDATRQLVARLAAPTPAP